MSIFGLDGSVALGSTAFSFDVFVAIFLFLFLLLEFFYLRDFFSFKFSFVFSFENVFDFIRRGYDTRQVATDTSQVARDFEFDQFGL